jgi:hypothetical protein
VALNVTVPGLVPYVEYVYVYVRVSRRIAEDPSLFVKLVAPDPTPP